MREARNSNRVTRTVAAVTTQTRHGTVRSPRFSSRIATRGGPAKRQTGTYPIPSSPKPVGSVPAPQPASAVISQRWPEPGQPGCMHDR